MIIIGKTSVIEFDMKLLFAYAQQISFAHHITNRQHPDIRRKSNHSMVYESIECVTQSSGLLWFCFMCLLLLLLLAMLLLLYCSNINI